MKMKKQKQLYGYALITGATGGLGKAFVYALAKKGYKLLLTGRSAEKLACLQAELKATYPETETHIYSANLQNETDRSSMFSAITAYGHKIGMLVNVAGADIQKAFCAYTQEKIAFQCRVNFEACVSLCKFALDNRAEGLEIINVSSVSGLYPMPYFAIYSATKTALTSFSVALRQEVKKQGVHVTAVLPGAMPTREDIKMQIKGQGLWGKLAVKNPSWVAEYSIKSVAKNKAKTIPGFWNKTMRVCTAWIPTSWKLKFIARRWSKIQKDAF